MFVLQISVTDCSPQKYIFEIINCSISLIKEWFIKLTIKYKIYIHNAMFLVIYVIFHSIYWVSTSVMDLTIGNKELVMKLTWYESAGHQAWSILCVKKKKSQSYVWKILKNDKGWNSTFEQDVYSWTLIEKTVPC